MKVAPCSHLSFVLSISVFVFFTALEDVIPGNAVGRAVYYLRADIDQLGQNGDGDPHVSFDGFSEVSSIGVSMTAASVRYGG